MTTLPVNPSNVASRGPIPSGAPLASIDPVRILNKYKWVLVAAAILGGGLGVAAHYALATLAPVWRPTATFNVVPPPGRDLFDQGMASPEELSRFMATQTRVMTSDIILTRVVENPELLGRAPEWSGAFTGDDGRFNSIRALERLRDQVSARIVPQTTLIELSMSSRHRLESTGIVGMLREAYLQYVRDQNRNVQSERTRSLNDELGRIAAQVQTLTSRREALIGDRRVESVDTRASSDQARIAGLDAELLRITNNLEGVRSQRDQMIAQLESPAGIVFSDDMKSRVDQMTIVMVAKQQLTGLESAHQAMLQRGVARDHRDFVRLQGEIEGARQNLERIRGREMRSQFDGQLDQLAQAATTLEQQRVQLETSRAEISRRLVDLTRIQTELADIERQLNGLDQQRVEAQSTLSRIIAMNEQSNAGRIVLAQAERAPNVMAFPNIRLMVPAGVLLTLGLVGGFVLVRELLDQRIKAPSDVNLIPRARLLGWVPDASEEPDGAGAPETAFRDKPRGALAESFRNLRSVVARRMGPADHRVLLVVAARPDSGATTVVVNLALGFAAEGRRVLLIDGNLRRPALHRIFAIQESPGLADALIGERTLDQLVQRTSAANVDLLSVGSRESRVVERLGASKMADLLAKAKAAYDVVLIDVAPAVVAGDAVTLAQRCDASILIVRALAEKRGLVARVKNDLSDSAGEFLGVVVNAVKASAGGYLRGNIKVASAYHEDKRG